VENKLKGPYLRDGEVVTPNFNLPFSVIKTGKRRFEHNATPFNQVDFKDATEIYVSKIASQATGLNPIYPITLRKFVANYNNGEYGHAKKFILNVIDNVFFDTGSLGLSNIDADILIRSSSPVGFTWFGRIKRPTGTGGTSSWVNDSGVFKTT